MADEPRPSAGCAILIGLALFAAASLADHWIARRVWPDPVSPCPCSCEPSAQSDPRVTIEPAAGSSAIPPDPE